MRKCVLVNDIFFLKNLPFPSSCNTMKNKQIPHCLHTAIAIGKHIHRTQISHCLQTPIEIGKDTHSKQIPRCLQTAIEIGKDTHDKQIPHCLHTAIEIGKFDTHNKQIRDRSLFWLYQTN